MLEEPTSCGSALIGEAAYGFLTLNGNGSCPPSSWCARPGHGQRSINERSDVTSPSLRTDVPATMHYSTGGKRGSALGKGSG